MFTDWDNAHTDYTAPPHRPTPAGLAESETDWRDRLQDATPGGWLLSGNAMTAALASGATIHLMHTTVALEAIRASRQLYASSGCLVAAIYCTPLTSVIGGLRPHNLGTYLLETKKHTRTLVFTLTPDAPIPPAGIDYLRLGPIHLRTYQQHRTFLTASEDAQLRRAALTRLATAAPFLDIIIANACGKRHDAAPQFVDRLAATVPDLPFLGYLYFEVLSEYLMLHSTSSETKDCAERGEMNNRLYKRMAFLAVPGMDQLFDLARFCPTHRGLLDVIGRIEPGLVPGAAAYVQQRLSHLFAALCVDAAQDASAVTFSGLTFDAAEAAAPSLLGQMLFRDMRIIRRYPQLYLAIEQAKALQAWSYWNARGIATPFNGFLPKGEIGINVAYPRATCTVWRAETCERGLLHPVEPLDAELVPRLADLSMTAMRRDEHGRAAGHRQAPAGAEQLQHQP